MLIRPVRKGKVNPVSRVEAGSNTSTVALRVVGKVKGKVVPVLSWLGTTPWERVGM
jgi:hypothetical protein